MKNWKFWYFLEHIYWYFSLFLLLDTNFYSLSHNITRPFRIGFVDLVVWVDRFSWFPSLSFSLNSNPSFSPSPHYYPITFDPDLHLSLHPNPDPKPKNNLAPLSNFDLIFYSSRADSVFSLIEKGKWSGETMDEEVLIERLPIMTHRLILRCSNWYSTTELDSTGL